LSICIVDFDYLDYQGWSYQPDSAFRLEGVVIIKVSFVR